MIRLARENKIVTEQALKDLEIQKENIKDFFDLNLFYHLNDEQ